MKISSVSYSAYKNTDNKNSQNKKISFGEGINFLKGETSYFLGSLKVTVSNLVQGTKFTPLALQTGGTYTVNRYFRPQVLYADALIVPEQKCLEKGEYHINKFAEIKGLVKKGAKIFFNEMLESSKDSKIEGELIGKVDGNRSSSVHIDGQVIETKIIANNIYLETHSDVQKSNIEAVSRVAYDKKQRKGGGFDEIPYSIAGMLEVEGKVTDSELKGYNTLVKYDGNVNVGAIIAQEDNAISGIVRNAELIDGNRVHIYSGNGAEVVSSQINIFSKVFLYTRNGIKPTPIRYGTICTRPKEEAPVISEKIRFESLESTQERTDLRAKLARKESQKQQIEIERLRLTTKKRKKKEREKLVSLSIFEALKERPEKPSKESAAQRYLRQQQKIIRAMKKTGSFARSKLKPDSEKAVS